VAERSRDLTYRVLKALEADARLSPEALARMVGASEDDVTAILHRMHRERVIRRHKTVVDWEKVLGERVVAFIDASVSPEHGAGFDEVAARICRYPEVRSVHLISGSFDLRIVVEGSSLRDVAAFVAERLAPIERVTATNTHFVLKAYKEDGEVLAEEPDEDRRMAVSP
jgi:DNA-binding Lrp family transcriptional regulator